MKPIIECHRCHGKGQVEMSDELFETLKAVGKESTVDNVLTKLKWRGHPTAINNRLEELRALGFLSRVRIGRQWQYSTAK